MAEYVLGGLTYTSPVTVPGSLPPAVATVVGTRPAMVAASVTPPYVAARPSATAPVIRSGSGYGDRYAMHSGSSSSMSTPAARTSGGTSSGAAASDPGVATGEGVDTGVDTGVDLDANTVTGVLPDGTMVTVKDTTGLPLPSEKKPLSPLVWWGLGALVLLTGGVLWLSRR